MKIKLFFENEKAIRKSGIGKALEHQKAALALNGIAATSSHEEQDFDVLHVNTVWMASMREARRARRRGKAVVCHAHSTQEDFRNSFAFSNWVAGPYRRWLIRMYRLGDCIVTPTEYSKSILEGYGIKKPIFAVSNGVDVEAYRYDENKVKAFRAYFGLAPEEKVVISVGWVFLRKGFDTFCKVARRLPQYRFIWFGDVQMSMPPRSVQEMVHNKPDNLILPGYVTGDVMLGAYMGCDCFFFPSREETEGIVVLEALAARCHVLVRDIGAYQGWLIDRENCYKGTTEDDFASLIPQIVEGTLPDMAEVIERGYQTAEARNLRVIGEKLKEVYELALQSRKKR